jgi:hypothetical protein
VPTIAVVQDGTELARQTDADISGCFEECVALLSDDGTAFDLRVFTDESTRFLLDAINPREYACIVIASNALNSGQVERAMHQRDQDLRRYVRAGGGLVVLHQVLESLSLVLPEELCPQVAPRKSRRGADKTTAGDPDDVMLHYPGQVDLARFVDGGFSTGPPSLFYRALPARGLPASLKPVLSYSDEVLLARTYDYAPERVVITTLPLDWQRATELLANAIRFAALGFPRRLVWLERAITRRRLLVRWLATDGAASVRVAPDGADPLGSTERWLLEHVDVAVVPPGLFDVTADRSEVRGFLANGGTLVSTDDVTSRPGSEVTALVGAYTERTQARRLYAELRAGRGWDSVEDAFKLRNVVAAVAMLWANPPNRTAAAVSVEELARLGGDVRLRLRDRRHREDLSSSIAHVQTLAFLRGDKPVDADLVDWMVQDPRCQRFDVGLQVRAVTAVAQHRPDPEFLSAVAASLASDSVAVALPAVVRVLDALAVLAQAGRLDPDPAAAVQVAERVCQILEDQPPDVHDGWLSIEATVDVVRGLIALLGQLPQHERELTARVADLLGTAGTALRRALSDYRRDTNAVSWLARVTHAVVIIDRTFPLGLQRLATLDWPETVDPGISAAGERSLLEQLAVENKQLRDREVGWKQSELAARVGRGTATLGVTAILAVPLLYLLAKVGWASVWKLLGNLAIVLTLVLGLVAGAFTLLTRWHLLARPAEKVRDWIAGTVPYLSQLSKLGEK